MIRPSKRANDKLRDIKIITNYTPYAEGSCLISFGNTKVLCTASLESKVPHFLKGTNKGWITAEYGMLPRSTLDRVDREAVRGKQSGRTQEIQRLIGRSLRSAVDLRKLGEKQIKIDCDVLQADGGTRTASICGAYVALFLALQYMKKKNLIDDLPIIEDIAAVSCGVYKNNCILDLDYAEDSCATADANFVMTSSGKIIEVQICGEANPIDQSQMEEMFSLAKSGTSQIISLQRKALMENIIIQ